MDPKSYGYNYMTPDNQYMTGNAIVSTLVDMVSKNGNFLLDIGPKHDGSIPQIMQTNLLDAGSWINAHAESIFNTTYWNVQLTQTTPPSPLRYTTTNDAFYIHYIGTPPTTLSITDPIPYLAGDVVTVIGGTQNGVTVPVTFTGIGTLKLQLSNAMITGDKYVYTFKIKYVT